LIIVSSLVDAKGPRETYARILEALHLAGIYQSVPITKIVAKSPNDSESKRLIEDLKRTGEGSIHLARNANKNGAVTYSVVFTPYLGSGGAIPSNRFANEEDLSVFLEKRVGIHSYVVQQALAELNRKNSATIFNVQLTFRRAKKLNLAA
jgi:hypothetical protein